MTVWSAAALNSPILVTVHYVTTLYARVMPDTRDSCMQP